MNGSPRQRRSLFGMLFVGRGGGKKRLSRSLSKNICAMNDKNIFLRGAVDGAALLNYNKINLLLLVSKKLQFINGCLQNYLPMI